LKQAASNQNIQRVLQRQASLGKRSSLISNSNTPTLTNVSEDTVKLLDTTKVAESTNGNNTPNNATNKLTTTVTNGNGSNSKLSSSHTETAV